MATVCAASRSTDGSVPQRMPYDEPATLALRSEYPNLYILVDRVHDWRPPLEKPLAWCGSSLEDLRRFPVAARRAAGRQLNFVQHGSEPSDWRAMATIGPGAFEIRIHVDGEHRVVVVTKFVEAVYVLHAFEKKSSRTSPRDIDLARRRYRTLVVERNRR